MNLIWTAEDQRDADDLDAIYDYLTDVFLIWQRDTGRNVHEDRHGNWHGKAEDGTPLDTPHQYDPEFLAYLREWGELEDEDLAEGEPPRWHDYLTKDTA
jgi:hypothetical protein